MASSFFGVARGHEDHGLVRHIHSFSLEMIAISRTSVRVPAPAAI